ncbi:MAG: hypothetical protein H6706_14700 [Myxococcales bacterium]|nr:hypothetical protein [Myxococcales bacterium]
MAGFGCDDGDGGGGTPVADMAVADRGIIRADGAPVDQGPMADLGVEVDQGAGGGPDQGVEPVDVCDRVVGYGLQAAPAAAIEGAPRFTPRAVWTGVEWGALWQAPTADEPGVNEVFFRRFNADGQPVGEPVMLGVAKQPQQEILFNGTGYVAVWLSTRTRGGGIDGIKVQLLGADGTPNGEAQDVPGTFDVAHLDAAWAPRAGGMVVYTRGMGGVGGLFAAPLDESGAAGRAVQLSDSEVRGPAVAFGDGAWGVAWLDRASENPADVLFGIINDRGELSGMPPREAGAGAQSAVYVAYGQGNYGVGWSRVDGMGALAPMLTLYDTAGDNLATAPVTGPRGLGLVTDVAWLDPDSFGVGWQDNGPQITVGMTRVNVRGQVLEPFRLDVQPGRTAQAIHVAGNVSRAGFWFVDDPDPQPGGTFSAEARILGAILGPCR